MVRCDAYGRLLCPLCFRPMARAAQHDRGRAILFSCETCEAVEIVPLRTGGRPAGQESLPLRLLDALLHLGA